jgi:hypothetical protein
MEDTLNKILSELQHLHVNQQELMAAQNGLIVRIENLEKSQRNSGATSTRNINKVHQELMFGQQQVKIRMENLENKLSLGQNELKELILQTTAYMSGRLSVSERLKMEFAWGRFSCFLKEAGE